MPIVDPLAWIDWTSDAPPEAGPTKLVLYAVRHLLDREAAYRESLKERFGEHSAMLGNWDYITRERAEQYTGALLVLSQRLEDLGVDY